MFDNKPDSIYPDLSKALDSIRNDLRNVDPDDFAPNRTAKHTEQIVEILQSMDRSAKSESIKNRNRFIITSVIAGIAALAAILGLVHSF